MSRVEEVLMMVKHVPPFPKVAQRVMELLENPDTTAAQLAEVIQGLVADVLVLRHQDNARPGRHILRRDRGEGRSQHFLAPLVRNHKRGVAAHP